MFCYFLSYFLCCRTFFHGSIHEPSPTPEALYAIGVLVTVADGSRHDEGGVVSAGRGLGVGEGSCMLP